MTDDLKTRIDAILAQCREIIALSEKVTPGPWVASGKALFGHVKGPSLSCHGTHDNASFDASFIATSRTLTPQLARALIEAIEGLVKKTSFVGTLYWLAKESEMELERIADQFTQPLTEASGPLLGGKD